MRIGIDARFALGDRRGIGKYTLKLIDRLSHIDNHNEYILYTHREDVDRVLPNDRNFRVVVLSCPDYVTWEQLLLPMQVRKDRVDLLHCVANTAPALFPKNTRLVLTLHDVMFLKGKEMLPLSSSVYQRLGRLYRRINVPSAVRNAHAILTVSDYSKTDILHHFPALDSNKVRVTHLGVDELLSSQDTSRDTGTLKEKFGIIGEYIMALGARDPRKNTNLVVEAFLELKRHGAIEGYLVLVGGRMPTLEKFLESDPHGCDVLFTGFVDENDLGVLYRNSTMFIYPSLYEGFGLPPLEAMFHGTPVIASSAGSIPEIVGDAALVIEPTTQTLISEILCLKENSELRADLVSKGASRVSEFSWNKMAGKTLETYNEIGR